MIELNGKANMKIKRKLKELDNCVTVDVGKNTAMAFWDGTFFPSVELIQYTHKISTDVVKYLTTMKKSFKEMLFANAKPKGSAFIQPYKFIQIEGVELWDKSDKSLTSAKRKDLFYLSYLVGFYGCIASDFTNDLRIVNAPEWKGQLTKAGTVSRVKRINGIVYENEHKTDAVAMGFSNVEDVWLLERSYK